MVSTVDALTGDWQLIVNLKDRATRKIITHRVPQSLLVALLTSHNNPVWDGKPCHVSGPWADLYRRTLTYNLEVAYDR